MKSILSIVGARPQFIKHAPVQLELQQYFRALTLHTGQHYDNNMSDIFFKELKMPKPDYHLTLTGRHHGEQTAQMMIEIEKVVIQEKPSALLVYGDTNSTLAGALVASKLHIPVVHIEAGLRSFNKEMPEEINRILTDHVSDLLFCPSETAITNLSREGVTKNVYRCGDVMKDMLYLAEPFLEQKIDAEAYYFATIHRPYNTDNKERLLSICGVFQQLDAPVVFAIHPRTRHLMNSYGVALSGFPNIQFIEPVGYFDSLSYQKHAKAVITDSGGMQKEAYWLQKKCITVRKETEWVETLKDDSNVLVFENLDRIAKELETNHVVFDKDLYGDGKAARDIVRNIRLFVEGLS